MRACAVLPIVLLALACSFLHAADGPVSVPDLYDNPFARPVSIPPLKPIDGIPEIHLSAGAVAKAILPLHHGPRIWVFAKNTGRQFLALDFTVYSLETSQRLPAWPQPNVLYLAPGETGGIFSFMDELWGLLVDAPYGESRRTFRVDVCVRARSDWPFIDPAEASEKNAATAPEASLVVPCTILKTTWNQIDCSRRIQGTIRFEPRALSPVPVEILVLLGEEKRLLWSGKMLDEAFLLDLPREGGFVVRAHGEGMDTGYAYVPEKSAAPVRFILRPREWAASYGVRKSFNLPPGFWRGACARKSGRILVVQGMEHWLDPSLKKSSRLVLMDYRANVLWKHPMGWESWACDLSEDGAWAVYATCPDEAAGRESILTALRGIDGRPLWSRAVAELDPVRPLECREVRISPGNRYLAVGTGLGTLVVLALADGIPAWSAFCGGQVRRLRFFDQDRLLLAGAGDGNLHAFETATGRLLWKTFVWGWAFTDGIDVTADRRYIAVGTKNGYACVLDAATGRRIWAADLGQPVHHVTFSPKGDLLAAGGGRICVFRTSTGEMAWQGGFSTSCAWFDEGRFLVAADRTAAVYTAGGTLLALPARTAGSVNFLYASEDGARIVMATDRGEIVAIEGATQRYRSGDEEPEHP